jgi:hypothetical protein
MIVPEATSSSTSDTKDLDLVMNDQISTPLGTKSPSITIEHEQPHGSSIIDCCDSNGILLAI